MPHFLKLHPGPGSEEAKGQNKMKAEGTVSC